jgi:hypothetical protein
MPGGERSIGKLLSCVNSCNPAGDHVVSVTRPGFVSVERRIQVRGGASETVNITLDRQAVASAVAPAAAAPVPAPEEAAAAPPPRPRPTIAPLPEEDGEPAPQDTTDAPTTASGSNLQMSIPPLLDDARASESNTMFTPPVIVAGVVSGSFLIGAGLLGLAAVAANNDFDNFKARANNPALPMMERDQARTAAADAADRADGRALTADLFLGAALISGGVAAYFILTQDEPGEEATITAGIGPGSVALSARF